MPEKPINPQSSQPHDTLPPPRSEWTPPRLKRLGIEESGGPTVKGMIGVEHDVYRPS